MKIVIKNPAPKGDSGQRWGDYHFGQALQKAFEAKGVQVVQHFNGSWDGDGDEDVVLVLRGLLPYEPPPGRRAVLWIISHPANVSKEEVEKYDLIYCASHTLTNLIQSITDRPVRLLRQCTDVSKFRDDTEPASLSRRIRQGTIFVANARGIRRDVAWWASRCVDDLQIYGGGWEYFGLQEHVVKDSIANEDLPALYHRARIGLNDHWADMRHFGLINNRIFDCLACGLPVVSDSFPELRKVFGDSILYADTEEEFQQALVFLNENYPLVLEKARSFWENEGPNYSFDTRATQILEDVRLLLESGADAFERQQSGENLQWLPMLWASMAENARCQESQVKARERLISEMQRNFDRDAKQQQKIIKEMSRYALFVERELARLKASLSWRCTDPLRRLKRIVRQLMGSPARRETSISNRRPRVVEEYARNIPTKKP